jgi:anti-sigma factor RsiW
VNRGDDPGNGRSGRSGGSGEIGQPGDVSDEELSALIDGELEPEHAAALRERLGREPALARRLAGFERVDAALRALPALQPAASAQAELRARVGRVGVDGRSPRIAAAGQPRFWAGAAIAAAATGIVFLLLPGSLPEEPALADATLAEATEEEIGIALHFETLAEFDVIEDLELLELLDELEAQIEEVERG